MHCNKFFFECKLVPFLNLSECFRFDKITLLVITQKDRDKMQQNQHYTFVNVKYIITHFDNVKRIITPYNLGNVRIIITHLVKIKYIITHFLSMSNILLHTFVNVKFIITHFFVFISPSDLGDIKHTFQITSLS